MTKFRQHRGGYDESMATTEPCHTFEDLARILIRLHVYGAVELKHYGRDDRNGWNTHLVLVDGDVFGMTDGLPPR